MDIVTEGYEESNIIIYIYKNLWGYAYCNGEINYKFRNGKAMSKWL